MFRCAAKTSPEKRESKNIDRLIKQWHDTESKMTKLLLLGAGEAGKSTIIKQMKILHVDGFTKEEILGKIPEIRYNIHEAIYEIVSKMARLEPPVELADESNRPSYEFLLALSAAEVPDMNEEYYNHVELLWSDAGVRRCYARSEEYQLIDSAAYFLDKLSTIRRSDYWPSEQDLLRSRKRTTGIVKIEFSVKVPKYFGGGIQTFWMFDVGGQRGERKKWLQVFDGIDAVLFLIACNDFDQKLWEEDTTNRFEEALELFESMWISRFLKESGFIVFLNKQDLLELKIKNGKSIQNHFPEYASFNPPEANNEYERTRLFMKYKLMLITGKRIIKKRPTLPGLPKVEEDSSRRECYFHYTTATDTDNVKRVFDDVQLLLIKKNLRTIGLN